MIFRKLSTLSLVTLNATVLGAAAFLAGCNASTDPAVAALASTEVTGTQLISAKTTACPNGGTTIVVFKDSNLNGVMDAGEAILSTSNICDGANGAAGAAGIGQGIAVSAAPTSACVAGGSIFQVFSDVNGNGQLDAGERIVSTSAVCNGVAGANGQDGQSASLTVSAATSAQCAAGGSVYVSQSPGQSAVSTVVCNGTNGANGQNAQFELGPVGSEVHGQAYSACHHDYLYFPGSAGARGWLTFRHQANGAADQGIGSTGFQVWNVDIADFALISEVGGVTYCALHWDESSRKLTYTVIDNTDGLAGQTDTIQL